MTFYCFRVAWNLSKVFPPKKNIFREWFTKAFHLWHLLILFSWNAFTMRNRSYEVVVYTLVYHGNISLAFHASKLIPAPAWVVDVCTILQRRRFLRSAWAAKYIMKSESSSFYGSAALTHTLETGRKSAVGCVVNTKKKSRRNGSKNLPNWRKTTL